MRIAGHNWTDKEMRVFAEYARDQHDPAKQEPGSMTAKKLRAVRSSRLSTRFMW